MTSYPCCKHCCKESQWHPPKPDTHTNPCLCQSQMARQKGPLTSQMELATSGDKETPRVGE